MATWVSRHENSWRPGVHARSMLLAVYALLSVALLATGCAGERPAAPPPGAAMSGESAPRDTGAAEDIAGVIFVVPLEGAPSRTALILADAIAAEIRDGNHPAILSYEPNQAGASVVGQLASADIRGNVIWLGIDWSIRAPYGTHVTTYRQHVVVDAGMWRTAAPEAINLIIADAAPKIAGMVNDAVGPPVLAAMHHPDVTPPATAREADPAVAGTTMDVRRRNMKAEPESAPTPMPLGEGAQPQAAPGPGESDSAQVTAPLARIADATNGQVVRPEGAIQGQAQGANQGANQGVTQGTTLDTPAPATAAAPSESEIPPPDVLPSLLTLDPEQAPAGSATQPSGPPQPLTPGATAVSRAPGVTQESASAQRTQDGDGSGDSGSFLDILDPNMDADKRLPDDARPAGPGGAAFAKVRWGQPSFLIKPVTGAPGNGNEALTAALKSALRDRDLTISEDPRQAGFLIQGVVDTGEPVNGRQYIRIIWRVNTVTGEEVGKAVQENTVVAGSLDGEWGQVAEAVSYAAVRGIKDLFGDADERITSREPLPDFPDVELPSVPGRAPPPPAAY